MLKTPGKYKSFTQFRKEFTKKCKEDLSQTPLSMENKTGTALIISTYDKNSFLNCVKDLYSDSKEKIASCQHCQISLVKLLPTLCLSCQRLF
jgi:hypothetical protein